MSSRTIYFELTETIDDRFDRPIEWMLAALMVFAPLAVGSVQLWSEWAVILLASAMAGMLGAKLVMRRDMKFVQSWTYLPIAVVLGLGIFQLLPLPPELVRAISPDTYQIKTSLLETARAKPSSMTLSFYPEATLRNLRILVAISAVYVVALNVIRRFDQVRRIMMVMVGVGSLVAVIGLAHLMLGASRVYGLFGENLGPWLTGPFINRNHFGQFVNMCLGAAVGLILIRLDEVQGGSSRSRRRGRAASVVIPADLWVLVWIAALLATSVFFSLSRGAILSLMIAAGVSGLVIARRGMSARVWALLPLAWVVALVVIYFGLDLIAGRFVQLTDTQTGSVAGRLTIAQDVLRAAKDAPIFGYGLGSFETVYPMFDSSQSASLATHAENEYAQALFEGGTIQIAMVLLFIGMIGIAYGGCVKRSGSPMMMPVVGLGMGILAVVIQSFTDFGQHLPANAVMTAVASAMVINLSMASRRTDIEAAVTEQVRVRQGFRPVGVMGTVIVLAIVLYDGFNAAAAEQKWMEALKIEPVLRDRDWKGSDDNYSRLLVAAKRATEIRPGDIQYRYWLNFYRFRYISQERDEQTGEILYDEQRLKWAEEIVLDVLDSIPAAPTYGPNYTLAGLIGKNVLQREGSEKLVRRGFVLARIDPVAAFEAAMLDADEGLWDEAMRKFEHASALSQPYRIEGAIALAGRLTRPDLAMKLANDDPNIVRRIVSALEGTGQAEAAAKTREQLNEMIRARADGPDADVETLLDAARLATAEKDHKRAVQYLDRLMLLDPTRAAWRLQLARALAAIGDLDRALAEAVTASRMSASGADQFVVELRSRAATRPATSLR